MNNQLSNISTQYRKFSKGQYIEHTQFNEFLSFFEDQDRLSKVMLQGVGIVCGLKPNLMYTNKILTSVQLSQGVAITTDGDLLTLNNTSEVSKELYMSDLKTINIESKNYTHFKVYDNFKVGYPSFYDEKGLEQVELWELATVEETNNDFQPISNLSNLQDKYVLLYLEDYEKDIKPCRGVDCDNHGVQQIRNLKVLVTTAKGIVRILGEDRLIIDPITGEGKRSRKDRVQPHPLFIEDVLRDEKQERVIVERLILEKGADMKFSSSDLKGLYSAALEKNNYGKFIFEKINKISEIMGVQSIVNHAAFKNVLQQCFTQQAGFQYAYDVVKDVMNTYSEIIKLLPQSFTKGFPDLDSFPKHIMLGKLMQDTQLDFSRHQFYNSPVLDDEKATERVKVLMNRFSQQVRSFKYPIPIEIGPEIKSQIKITPSQKLTPLSNKAIPFYYQTSEEFLKAWNFDKTNNRSFRNNLAYYTGWLSSDRHIQEPLHFNIDKNSFYNIEGHQGMSYEEAFEQIKEIRDKLQLGFDIMVLSFEELKANKDMSKAYFNEYVEKHPGLEHKRGVERGGTFVMVYDNNGVGTSVVADFSLPYICCTPKIEAALSLPSTVICAESNRIPFTVIPVGGVVKAVADSELNGVEIFNGKYFFNPKLVDVSLHGKAIAFTVNGKPTNCSIKVIAEPEVKVVVDYVFYPEGNSTATIVNLIVSADNGQNIMDYTYSGNFWDNDSWVALKPDSKGLIKYTLYDVVPTRIPTIKVKVNGGGCTQDISIRDWYDAPVALSFKADIKDVICSGADRIPFNVSPVGGIVKADIGEGVKLDGVQYYFDPKSVDKSLHGQVIHFTVNGQQTNCSIKVITQPDVIVKVYQVDYPITGSNETIVHFNVSSPSGQNVTNYDYICDFGSYGNQVPLHPDASGNASHTLYNVSSKDIPVIKVKVSNKGCAEDLEIKGWYDAPSVTIKSIRFSDENCCQYTIPTITVKATGPTTVGLKEVSFKLNGEAQGSSSLIYSWAQLKGPVVKLTGVNKLTLQVENLVVEDYEFQLTAVDVDSGAFAKSDILKVNVYR
ncbi:hypothetical protein [Chryseobacterium sp. ERMR1:04]|uniref:PKD domain-containing protein n=1 Tax=Chryseobacterium sp. ERMR1:04 TaxID=1705393 RepID=UPI0006CD6971|nr:hypothetical protein [Chryseobacterium sp. ERMR1:04]KPH15026.1 hypothetical protein AMQ68_06365 [Chryseobacterium sp. ERMR1:04]